MIDSATRLREQHRIHIFDPAGLINDAYYATHPIGPKSRANPSDDDGSSPLMFAVKPRGTIGGDDHDDDSSPKLWKTSPAATPPLMSPTSRTEAIARGRRELMEMIKDMPESFYELSLRDIVDQETSNPVTRDDDDQKKKMIGVVADQRKKKAVAVAVSKKMGRSRSADNGGYLLKTSVFPMSFGMMRMRRRRKKTSLFSSGSLKEGGKGAEKEWWRRKASESDVSGRLSSSNSDRSSGSGSSSRSSSSNGRRQGQGKLSNRFLPGCCSFRGNK